MTMSTKAKKREQLKGYTQAVQEMSAVMAKDKQDQMASTYIAMEKLESTMRAKVLRLVEGQEETL